MCKCVLKCPLSNVIKIRTIACRQKSLKSLVLRTAFLKICLLSFGRRLSCLLNDFFGMTATDTFPLDTK